MSHTHMLFIAEAFQADVTRIYDEEKAKLAEPVEPIGEIKK